MPKKFFQIHPIGNDYLRQLFFYRLCPPWTAVILLILCVSEKQDNDAGGEVQQNQLIFVVKEDEQSFGGEADVEDSLCWFFWGNHSIYSDYHNDF